MGGFGRSSYTKGVSYMSNQIQIYNPEERTYTMIDISTGEVIDSPKTRDEKIDCIGYLKMVC